jgi:hypothetical protein
MIGKHQMLFSIEGVGRSSFSLAILNLFSIIRLSIELMRVAIND